jgi:lambda family phage holin
MPEKNPDLWAQLVTWLIAHRVDSGYALAAAVMALLRSAYAGRDSWYRRILDAAMCALVAFFIRDGLAAMAWDSSWATIGSVFIGFVGVDYLSSVLRRVMDNRAGTPSTKE